MNPPGLALRSATGVLGGWLAIIPPSVLTIALRVDEWDVEATTYANLLAAGWLTMLIALILAGRLNDLLRTHTGSRLMFIRIGAPLIALGGVLLALSPSVGWLAAAWILAQIPSAMVITAALAIAGDALPPNRRGFASGLVGAASIVALLIGSFIVRLLSESLALAFALPALLGAVLALPMMRGSLELRSEEAAPSVDSRSPISLVAWVWIAFLGASFLLSWATSTTNGFLVLFVEYVSNVVSSEVTATATGVVIVASLLAVMSSVLAGIAAQGRLRAVVMWITASFMCGFALMILLGFPTITGIFISAAIFGISFGVANGVELSIVLMLRNSRHRMGGDLGLFTAVTTAPFVLVPLVAGVMVRENTGSGLITLFSLATVATIVAGLVVVMIFVVSRKAVTVKDGS